jgi:TRAP-type C4-dicarboxylate transport system substrate-binding protein
MYLGWSINYQGVNLDSWNNFPPEVQAFFTEQFEQFEDKMWDTAAKAVADAENCNFGKEPCELGKMASMTLVPISEADKQKHAQMMQDVVLVEWARRCGKECATEWNETVGQAVGLEIPLDKV